MKHKRDSFIPLLSEITSYLAIGSLVFLLIGLKGIDNYLNWLIFSATLVGTGILFGTSLYFVLSYIIPKIKTYKNSKGIGMLFPLTFAFALIFFGLGRIINEASNHSSECMDYIIQDMGEGGSRTRTYYIFINNGKKTERLTFGKAFNKAHKIGDNISLCTVTGRLGYKYFVIKSKI